MTTPWPYTGQAVPQTKPTTPSAAPQRPARGCLQGQSNERAVERACSGTERRHAVVASRAAGDMREKSQAVCD